MADDLDDRDFDEGDEGADKKRPRRPKGFLTMLVVAVLVSFIIYYGTNVMPGDKIYKGDLSEYLNQLNNGTIEKVWITDGSLEAEFKPGVNYTRDDKKYTKFRCDVPRDYLTPEGFRILAGAVDAKNVHYSRPNELLYQFILPLIPWVVLMFLAYWFFFRQIRSAAGPGSVLSFARSRATKIPSGKIKVTFSDVAGIDEAKDEVKEIIEYLRDPQKFRRLGARVPRGVLLVGSPGTGKTLLAKAIAGEANVPFFSITGSDFVEMFVGVGAARVRDLFKQARENSPCIIFLDEIDAVGRRRGTGLGGGHDEREQTLNQILAEMDGFETDESVIVIAATNRADVLDPALMRPGRFDREIHVDLADVKGREEILKVHVKKIKAGKDVDLKKLAKMTPMFSGADLEAMLNEAAIIATMKKKETVDQEDVEEARDKVLWGRQKKSRVVEEEERKVTAYHEAGHTLINVTLPECDPFQKVTIIPRGRMGGATMSYPEKDISLIRKKKALAVVTMCYGGRVAEEITFGDISSGASNDIQRATDIARQMVCEWGMSEAMGPVSYGDNEEHLFLGREIARTRDHSEAVTAKIDEEVRKILDGCLTHAREIIATRRADLEKIAQALLKYETLASDELKMLLKGDDLDAHMKRKAEAEVPVLEPAKPASEAKKPLPGRIDPLPGPSRA